MITPTDQSHDNTSKQQRRLRRTSAAVESVIPSRSRPWPGASFQIPGIVMNPHTRSSPLMETQLLGQSQHTQPLPVASMSSAQPCSKEKGSSASLRRQRLLFGGCRNNTAPGPPSPPQPRDLGDLMAQGPR